MLYTDLEVMSKDLNKCFEDATLILTVAQDEKHFHRFYYKYKNKKEFNLIWGFTVQDSCLYKNVCEIFPHIEKKDVYKVIETIGKTFVENIVSEMDKNKKSNNKRF